MRIKAQLNNLRRSPRKVRLIAKMFRGLDVKEVENQLKFLTKGSTSDFEKLLKSAVSNAENNFGLSKDNLYIKNIIVNEGTKLKRWLPRAYGRASLILKRTSQVEMILAERVKGKGRKKVEKKNEIRDIESEEIKKRTEKEKEKIKKPAFAKILADREKKEVLKERKEKEFRNGKKKGEGARGFLRKVFRRKSI